MARRLRVSPARWIALVLAILLLATAGREARAVSTPPDYLTIKIPVGNNLIHGACCRISPGGLPQHSEQLEATLWNAGPNAVPQGGAGDDRSILDLSATWSVLGGEQDSIYDAYSGLRSLTDSPGGAYADNRNVAAEITQTFNLVGASSAELRFRHHYQTESGYDYCKVEIKKNGSWSELLSYNGQAGAYNNYLAVTQNLAAHLGNQVKFRLRFTSDTSVTMDGWHVDDFEVWINGARVFLDDFEAGTGAWTLQSPWGLEVPQVPNVLGAVDQNGLFTAYGKTGIAYVIASYPGAVSDTIDVKVVPPDWVAGP